MKEKVYKLKFYDTIYNVVLGKTSYRNNGTLAVTMIEKCDDGHEEDFGVLTVNIGYSDFMCNKDDTAFIDVNNLGREIKQWLVDNNIAVLPGILGESGFVRDYPLAIFTKEALDGMRVLG